MKAATVKKAAVAGLVVLSSLALATNSSEFVVYPDTGGGSGVIRGAERVVLLASLTPGTATEDAQASAQRLKRELEALDIVVD